MQMHRGPRILHQTKSNSIEKERRQTQRTGTVNAFARPRQRKLWLHTSRSSRYIMASSSLCHISALPTWMRRDRTLARQVVPHSAQSSCSSCSVECQTLLESSSHPRVLATRKWQVNSHFGITKQMPCASLTYFREPPASGAAAVVRARTSGSESMDARETHSLRFRSLSHQVFR